MPKSKYATSVQQAIDNEIAALRAATLRSVTYATAPTTAGEDVGHDTQESSSDERKRSASPVHRKEKSDADEEIADQLLPLPAPQTMVAMPPGAPASYPRPVAAPPPASFGAYAAPPARIAQPSVIVASLDERIARLEQVRRWIGEDGEMARFLDAVIGQQVKASERRTVRLSIALGIISLIAGWALSIFATPQTLAALFGR